MRRFSHFVIFSLYSTSFCFSFSGRFLYLSWPCCRFFPFYSLERLYMFYEIFWWSFFLILIIFSWWIFRHFYIHGKKFIKKLIKIIFLKKYLEMLQEFYALLNLNFIMICIIHKISVLFKITWIILKIKFLKCFFKQYNIHLFKTNNYFFSQHNDETFKLEKDKIIEKNIKMWEIFLDWENKINQSKPG